MFTVPHRNLGKRDYLVRKLVGETLDIPWLSKVGSLTPRGVKHGRGQEVLLPPDYTNYQDYWDSFLYVDFVHRAVSAKTATVWQEGFEAKATKNGSESEKQRADELLAALRIDKVLPIGTLYAIIFGNMWYEPLMGFEKGKPIKDTGKLAQLKPLDPTAMAAIVSNEDKQKGTVTEWVQLGPNGREEARWAGDELIHLRFNQYRGSPFGIGDLQCVMLTVKQLLYMEQKLPEIVRKRADPTTWRQLGNLVNGNLVALSQKDFDMYKQILSAIEPTEDIYTGPQVNRIEEVYKGAGIAARQGLESFLDHFKRKLQSGLAVPDILLGEGRMTTEATAKEQTELYHQDIRWKQRLGIVPFIEDEIFARENPPIQNVKYLPNPLTPDDVYQASQRLINEVKAGIVGPIYARKLLGYPEDEAGVGAVPITGGQGGGGSSGGAAAAGDSFLPERSEETTSIIEKGGKPYAVVRKVPVRKKNA